MTARRVRESYGRAQSAPSNRRRPAQAMRSVAPNSPTVAPPQQLMRSRTANSIIFLCALSAGVAGALSGVHPTGTTGIDPLYGALLGVLVTAAASEANQESRLVFAAVALGASRGLIGLPAGAALLLATTQVWLRRWQREIGALVGALGSQVILRWPHLGFLGLTTLIGVASVLPLLVSGFLRFRGRARRHVLWLASGAVVLLALLAGPVVLGTLLAKGPVTSGIAATREALVVVGDGHAGAAAVELRQANEDFRRAHRYTGSWWSMGAELIPVLAQQRQALVEATGAARSITTSAAAEATSIDYGSLRYTDGRINLATVAALTGPLAVLDTQLARAQSTLDRLRSPWLMAPIQRRLGTLGTQLARARHSADVASDAVKAAPGLLGGQGERRYFVAFMTTAESRGLGGYMGAYGVITLENGRITLTASGSSETLNPNGGFNSARPGAALLRGPPGFLTQYGPYLPQSSFGDLTYVPDLPTVNQLINEAYPQVGGQPIDGTLAIDPEGLASLLKITGPVTVPAWPVELDAANAADILLRQQYTVLQATGGSTARHDFLQDVLRVALRKLVSGSLPGPQTLAADLGPAARAGHLQFWSSHPSAQPLLRAIGVDGTFPRAGGEDLLAVTTSNSANNKTDAYLHRTINDKVTFDPRTGAVTDQVTITLRNGAPGSGLPNIVIGSYTGSDLPRGTNLTWLTVYSPLGIIDKPGSRSDIEPGSTRAFGVNAYSAFVTIPPRSTVTVSLTLVGHVRPGPRYVLRERLQPMANPDVQTVEVGASPGWKSENPLPVRLSDAEQQVIDVRFRPER
jgi:hypothetical protein